MIARDRGLKIIESTIEEANLPDDYFDAITMVQVLEHLKDPKGALRKLYRVLRPGGLIVAGVPNFLCLDRQVMGSTWLPLETPRHLYYFTPKSLRAIFNAIGFNTLQIRKKTIYSVTLSQIKKSCRLNSLYKRTRNITYIMGSPFIKLLTPKDYSSTFISIYARK
jgi:ubiquinone/menaquinone biosynthesis C-methylase UbiE